MLRLLNALPLHGVGYQGPMLSQEGLEFWNFEMKAGNVESQEQSYAKREPKLRLEDQVPRPLH